MFKNVIKRLKSLFHKNEVKEDYLLDGLKETSHGLEPYAQSFEKQEKETKEPDLVFIENEDGKGTQMDINNPNPDTDRDFYIWKYLRDEGFSKAQTAGIMGNLFIESGLEPTIVQGGSQSMTPVSGKGYGLAQWTYWSRQEALCKCAEEMGVQPGDLTCQLKFMVSEAWVMGVVDKMNNTPDTIEEQMDVWLNEYEKPGIPHRDRRLLSAKDFFNLYKNIY